MSSSVLDDVFKLLNLATELESHSRIEAATKYYEAVYLMKRYLERGMPEVEGEDSIMTLLEEKVRHYERLAASLIADDSSTRPDGAVLFTVPRSPISSDDSVFRPKSSSVTHPVREISFKTASSVLLNNVASQANTKLAHALDLDEIGKYEAAIAAYLEASEIYLTALQSAEKLCSCTVDGSDAIATVIKRRLTQTLDRVEQLKNMTNPHDNKKQGNTMNYDNDRASQVRRRDVDNFSTISQQSHLTADEIEILKKSSLIASGLFLPWSDNDARQLLNETLNFVKNHSQFESTLFTDPDGFLALSPKQKERFHRWARPSEIVGIRQKYGLTRNLQTPVIIRAITPYTIKQQYVTDCSFVASLCICAAYERRFQKSLITSILHPQNNDGSVIYNPIGKYMVKLWLNGVARSVVIDDYLPIDKHGNLLCSHTSFPPKIRSSRITESTLELWVCLIEKAYMKLCGGYDFPGSNSGVDLFSLTGWIPERILFAKDPNKVKDFETHPERAFERIFSACSFGDCLITVSTELKLTETESDAIGLVSGHAYAVLNVIQTKNGTRLLQLKNPWAHKGWRGRYSSHDTLSWKDPAFRTEVGYDPDLARQQDDGVFWVCWQDILKYFQNFHLSWNPLLFKFRLVVHGFWPASVGPTDDTFNIGENPQYILNFSPQAVKKKATIWILISRHVTKQEQSGAEAKDYLTVHLHRNKSKNERIWYPGKTGNCVLTGVYTNNPHVLVRYDIEGKEDEHLSIVLSQYKKCNDLGYTLSCFCTENFNVGKPKVDPTCAAFSCAWTTSLSGGPVGRSTFFDNPMFAVKVPEGGTNMQITVSTITTAAVNVLLVPVSTYGEGAEKAIGEAVIDSGNYRHGFIATTRRKVGAGSYVVIVSNFHKGETVVFNLKIFSSSLLKVERIK